MRLRLLALSVTALAALGVGCAEDKMKVPTDPGVYRTGATSSDSSGAPLDLNNTAPPTSKPYQVGMASWYGSALAGKKTASGEPFNPSDYTAAHNTLKLGTWVEVRRIDTGRTVRVKINDRGPHAGGRIIDLSRRAAEDLDVVRLGVVKVEIRVVDGP